MGFFEYMGVILERLLSVIPRLIIIKSYEGGVKWVRGKNIKTMGPGIYVYLPLITHIKIDTVALQPHDLPFQSLTTKDNKTVVLSTVLNIRILDVRKAFGETPDIQTVICDIGRSAVAREVFGLTYEQLKLSIEEEDDSITSKVQSDLEEYGVFVEQVKIIEMIQCKNYRILQDITNSLNE